MAKDINLDVLRGTEHKVTYPSEDSRVAPLTKNLPGRTLTGRRERIDPNKTTLFSGNPRNFSSAVNLEDLLPLVIRTGGNSTPVDARIVNGRVEIIAGSRRRASCIEAGLQLVCDVWDDVSDEEAHLIAEMENGGRSDIDFMGYCTYLAHRFDERSAAIPGLTVERFAQSYSTSRQNMQDKISIGRLPTWLKDSAGPGADWSHRQGRRLVALYKQLGELKIDIQQAVKLPLSTPSMVLARLQGMVPASQVDAAKDAISKDSNRLIKVGNGHITTRKSGSGAITIETKGLEREVESRILDFLDSLKDQ